ncbi:cytochrome c oxidase assembly protein subunit 15 [Microlunatus sagamiharensis]|uniref:Cytochrome c oxidase assembly protein subunit 15 n=1 Tax=Microlunatus sagamiharensis TaxID=546874 RepID=A0A1H2MM63_9ACTN|nr:COX15/CtaA family protein [Microlunatus sagamiharensis]SDU94330.1 cytochrome c oxidase assembly protein subunit 15 [Microlunatus sagamiharensis]
MTATELRPAPDDRTRTAPWEPVLRLVTGPTAMRRWAVAALAINVVIVVTGGLVRLTASGMGCPTWPRCSEDSFVTHPELGIHGAIEFGNRLLTFVLVVVVALTWITALRLRDKARLEVRGGRRRDVRWLAGGLLLGIPAQIVIGGISVLTHLNPWVVGLHFLVSMALVGLATGLVRVTWPARRTTVVQPLARVATRVTFVGMVVAVWLGTVVTGSGPHAGDLDAVRNGLDGGTLAHLHAAAVWVTMAATVVCLVFSRSLPVLLLLAVEVFQAVIGLTQYHLGVPVPLVALHLLGASLSVAAATNLLLALRRPLSALEARATA